VHMWHTHTHTHTGHYFLPYLQVINTLVSSTSYSSPSKCTICEVLEHICIRKDLSETWFEAGNSVWSFLTPSFEHHHFCSVVFNSTSQKWWNNCYNIPHKKLSCCHDLQLIRLCRLTSLAGLFIVSHATLPYDTEKKCHSAAIQKLFLY
jgi:hypothetical protein